MTFRFCRLGLIRRRRLTGQVQVDSPERHQTVTLDSSFRRGLRGMNHLHEVDLIHRSFQTHRMFVCTRRQGRLVRWRLRSRHLIPRLHPLVGSSLVHHLPRQKMDYGKDVIRSCFTHPHDQVGLRSGGRSDNMDREGSRDRRDVLHLCKTSLRWSIT